MNKQERINRQEEMLSLIEQWHESGKIRQTEMIYSFLETCKINNIKPYTWLKETLNQIPDHSIQKLDEPLPCRGV
jgi:hypothetical protein